MVNVNEERVQSLSVNGQRGLHCIHVTLGDFILTRIVHPKRTVRSFPHPHVVQTRMLLFFAVENMMQLFPIQQHFMVTQK